MGVTLVLRPANELAAVTNRFFAKVNITSGCWLWTAAVNPQGYGRFVWHGRVHRSHRVAWFLANGCWPDDCVCHTCDVPGCVRIDHLFEGSRADNNVDRHKKGRDGAPNGELSGTSKLTAGQVKEIRHRFRTGVAGFRRDLAEEFGVSDQCLLHILQQKTWSDTAIGTRPSRAKPGGQEAAWA